MGRLPVLLSIILPIFATCQLPDGKPRSINDRFLRQPTDSTPYYATIGDIPLPEDYRRLPGNDPAFADWLLHLPLRKDPKVYLYDGRLKPNQHAQFAVLDMSVGDKDLQQCADAVMRLRAEWLYSQHRYRDICFYDNNKKAYPCPAGADRAAFDKYLERVYASCGTLSLEKQLRPVDFDSIQPGDVLIRGGSPGHAVMVMAVAVNEAGKKAYLLAQSYMPAQNIHILRNGQQPGKDPWYAAEAANPLIYTPEWTFSRQQLRRW